MTTTIGQKTIVPPEGKIFGKELFLDLYFCDPKTVNDLRLCYDFLDKAVDLLGVAKQAPPFIFQSPTQYIKNGKIVDCSNKAGLSGFVPLIESSVVIHTLVPKNFVTIDFYTCGNLDTPMIDKMVDFAKRTFNPKKLDIKIIRRGENYYT
jgi:S-adenosylmethionine/arginine decarboxylase-like enzyme